MAKITIREAVITDIAALASCLRDEDRVEVLAQGYKSTGEALQSSFNRSKSRFTLCLGQKPVALFGLVEIDGKTANVWLLGSPSLSGMKKSFVQLSREVITGFLVEYGTLFAQVDGRYKKTARWLEWLGAEAQKPYLLNGVEFHNFVFHRQPVEV